MSVMDSTVKITITTKTGEILEHEGALICYSWDRDSEELFSSGILPIGRRKGPKIVSLSMLAEPGGVEIFEYAETPNVSELREVMNKLKAEMALLKHVHEEYKNKYSKESQLKAILIEARMEGLQSAIKIIGQLKPL